MRSHIFGQVSSILSQKKTGVCIASRAPLLFLPSFVSLRDCQLRAHDRFDPYYIRSLTRFSSAGVIPPLSVAQDEAVTIMEETCHRLALHMVLEVGDIQFLSNSQVLHARTAYKDHAPPAPRRHLMRLWLAVPEGEGGWKLPFWDSKWRKRGGVQVGDVAEVARVDAD